MNEADLNRVLGQARSAHPHVTWLGAVIDDGRRLSIIGTLDGLTANDRTGSDTTPAEAISEVAQRLNNLVGG